MGEDTVKQVAKLSGVSIRTLHHYDEIGLLKPARVGANGYRYYGRDELLRLQQILFHRELDAGDYDIFRMDLATRDVTPFISGPGEQSYPSWSPDGRHVAFASDRGAAKGQTDIYVADATGEIVSRVTANPGYNAYPSWSRDGRWLYFNSERPAGTRNVFRAAIDGAGRCRPIK